MFTYSFVPLQHAHTHKNTYIHISLVSQDMSYTFLSGGEEQGEMSLFPLTSHHVNSPSWCSAVAQTQALPTSWLCLLNKY